MWPVLQAAVQEGGLLQVPLAERAFAVVIIDKRAGSEALAYCRSLRDCSTLGILEFGDVALTGHGPDSSTISVGIEVKSVDDLLSSISTGRLGGHQIPGLVKSYDHAWLAIFGEVRPGTDNYLEVRKYGKWKHFKIGRNPVPYSYLEGFMLTAQMFAPLRVKWCSDIDELATWIAVYDRWLTKPWDKHRGLAVFDRSRENAAPVGADPIEAQIAKTAASLPGLDWVRGWSAAKHFESITEMMDADVDDWKSIKGIGPVIAKTVVSTVRRRK